ncbi:unnamed protein product [Trichobilharzia szidati]|nr:unnamed protein product [Trichobilharzia szidati]
MMRFIVFLFALYCIVIPTILINVNATETDHHEEEHHKENKTHSDMVKMEGGMTPIYMVMKESIRKGRMHICKVIDKYLRKDDLDKKLLEVAKIMGKRIEKRMQYWAMKMEEMLKFETS